MSEATAKAKYDEAIRAIDAVTRDRDTCRDLPNKTVEQLLEAAYKMKQRSDQISRVER